MTVYQLRRNGGHPSSQPSMKVTLIGNGDGWGYAISPDGQYVAYSAKNAKGEESIWLKLLATGYASQLISPNGMGLGVACFSPDGSYLYYSVIDPKNASEYFLGDVYRISIGGGASHKIASNVGGFSVSPNGKQMALLRVLPSRQEHDLIISNEDGTASGSLPRATGPTSPGA
jgi:tricorn protease-like protein